MNDRMGGICGRAGGETDVEERYTGIGLKGIDPWFLPLRKIVGCAEYESGGYSPGITEL